MGNWTSDKVTTYFNHRLVSDAKHFGEKGERGQQGYQPAATFLTIVDGTKGGEDIFVDVKVLRGAEKFAKLSKGTEVTIVGTVEFAPDRNGKLRGKIWNGEVKLGYAAREGLKAAALEADAPPPEAPADDGEAPAFE